MHLRELQSIYFVNTPWKELRADVLGNSYSKAASLLAWSNLVKQLTQNLYP